LLNLFLIPNYAASGAAFATVVAELMVLVVQCIYLRDTLAGLIKNINFGKILLALGCAGAVGLILHRMINVQNASLLYSLVLLGAEALVFFGIYGGLLLLMKEPIVVEIKDMGLSMIRKKK
jgi:peptidoglycan biosynthesis protein MviN/MurJ (putative lipid II flippase)